MLADTCITDKALQRFVFYNSSDTAPKKEASWISSQVNTGREAPGFLHLLCCQARAHLSCHPAGPSPPGALLRGPKPGPRLQRYVE